MNTSDAVFGPHLKGFPTAGASLTREQVPAQGWQLLRGDLALPLAVLKQSALQHNLHWMRDFCAQRGLHLAPHGKTSMSPELWQLQLDAGAWGISFATVFQAAVGARYGVPVLLIANQVIQRAELDALATLHAERPGLRSMFLVDSVGQVDAIEAWAADRAFQGRFEVLLELGLAGQRTGTRTADEALQAAARIAASPVLQLAGIECYEGTTAHCDHAKDRATVQGLMDRVDAIAREAIAQGWFAHEEIVLTAGGSAIFDLVAERLTPALGRPVRGVLRSGCYLTHDHQRYTRYLCCVGERLNLKETLKPALEVLACVQSQPEPGLALLSMGKRDVSYDLDLPQPVWRSHLPHRRQGGSPQPVPAHWRIDALNDQHAYLRFDATAPRA
ncbi:MAG: alanine racemase, partial [Hydrogenophaga sp.]|uniref:alanine racemase n=1 Tax=Hydrogenophaga sp. TaxID=1904254 RepID=UPI003D9BD686